MVHGIIDKKKHYNTTAINRFVMGLWEGEKMKKFQVKEWSWIVIACSFLVLAFTEKQIMFGVLGLSFLAVAFND
ncbi:TPA: hypothetical protein OT924_002176 [Enterococcus faecalis]|nr:hypothetical protein [Enterococcus faecalis]